MSSQIVTGYLDSAARNLGHTEQPQVSAHLHMCKLSSIAGLMLCLKHADRYKVAEEYVSVMYKLFESSWRDDAVVLDPKRGVYTLPTVFVKSIMLVNFSTSLDRISVSPVQNARHCFSKLERLKLAKPSQRSTLKQCSSLATVPPLSQRI
jgi:alkanesulfonate monooxygenase SsuD/methylene tetrahydromethanopterin reductase-like flavin-dependent oxidoreductase (luciferase family)